MTVEIPKEVIDEAVEDAKKRAEWVTKKIIMLEKRRLWRNGLKRRRYGRT